MVDASGPKSIQAKCDALAAADQMSDERPANPGDPVRNDIRARVIVSNVIDEAMREHFPSPDSLIVRSNPEDRFAVLKELRVQCDRKAHDPGEKMQAAPLSKKDYAPCGALDSARTMDDAVAAGTWDPSISGLSSEYKKLAAERHLKNLGQEVPAITASGDDGARSQALRDLRSRCFGPPMKP